MRRSVPVLSALLGLLLVAGAPAPAQAAKRKAKPPAVTKVTPLRVSVGQTLTLRGRNFRPGKRRDAVGFKRTGAAIVFVKSGISTRRMLKVKLPARLEKVMAGRPTRFRLRVLARRFGRGYTARRRSPLVSPRPAKGSAAPPLASLPQGDCDHDGLPNRTDADDDNDRLADTLEERIGTDGCKADSDGDGVQDGYEYRSAIDLNDDEYQAPNVALPFPGKRPYPNPLDGSDAGRDYDGDGLPMSVEQALWKVSTPGGGFADVPGRATPLGYSDGMQYSVSVRDGSGRRVPALPAAGYAKFQDFLAWGIRAGRRTVTLHDLNWTGHTEGLHTYGLLDVDRDGTESAQELNPLDNPRGGGVGVLSDDERDEDADGLANVVEVRNAMQPTYWKGCYASEPSVEVFDHYAGTSAFDADSDGDGVRDGADDADDDDVPNVMELSRFRASGFAYDQTDDGVNGTLAGGGPTCRPDPDLKADDPSHPGAYGQVNPFNPCLPDPDSRTCPRYFTVFPAPFEGPHWWALQ